MKIKLFPALIVLVTVSTAFTVVTDELHQAMTKMMQKMKSMKMTGNADYDFAMMMAEHHQGSIDMSDVIASSGKDEKIKNLAQSILDKQPIEQQRLRGHSNSSEPQHAARNEGPPGSNFSSEMNRIMSKMESDMNNMKMTNDYDHDFATMMIPHHQSAIDMVDAFLPHGQDQEIITLAEKIKSDSEMEKEELKKWLQNHSK